jgi:peptide/nickel transport system ATP-binding protein
MAVDGVSLAVPKRGTLGLVGESGCGKSTLARALVGLAPLKTGTVALDGEGVSSRALRSRAYRSHVQMVFQDPSTSLNPRMRIIDQLSEALTLARSGRRGRVERAKRAEELLDLVGMSRSALDRYPHQFSGGQRQRIAIARALAVEPAVILADEITSSLDVSVQATILNLMRDLQRELHLSYLFISHDLSTVRYMSDQVAVMYLGRIVEAAPVDDFFAEPRHPYTGALIRSIPQLSVANRQTPLVGEIPDPRDPPRGCRFHTRCPVGPLADDSRSLCVERDPSDDAARRPHRVACHFAREVGESPRESLATPPGSETTAGSQAASST